MKTFLKGLIIFVTVFGFIIIGLMFFLITASDPSKLHINYGTLGFFLYAFAISFSASLFIMIPMVFREIFWKNQKAIDEEIIKYQSLQKELQRKINKL